ncbi:MAG: hypothetical protein ABSH06_00355 [Thermodesulfobacteriota bacterium]
MKQEIFIPIIVASSALSGVIISQAISLTQTFLDRRHQKQILLRQKYEEMMFHFSDSLQWIQQVNMCRTQQEIFSLAQCPATRKALSLCLLYFPDLSGPANDYLLAQLSYYGFIIENFNENIPVTAGGQAFTKPECKAPTDNLFAKKNHFEDLIISTAKKYTKA